jgi:OOP family OmpA-OmpF porin
MNDTDKDGVADYLDQENNTPAGVTVDTRGKFIDTNKNGVPDELERKAIDAKEGKDGAIVITKEDAIKTLLEKGYLSIFFDTNKDYPNTGSTSNVYQIIKFLKNYPDATATLVGYADLSGNENKNIELSSRRAKNVFDIIVASGINPSRLKVTSEGVDKSFSTSQTGLSLSRRVSILIK